MSGAPLALAFAAGLVATVNPCGFAMLPAYIAWFVGARRDASTHEPLEATLGRALLVGVVVSAGFLAVFGAAGLLLHAGLRLVIDLIPWAALAVGVVVVALGALVLSGRHLWSGPGREAPSQPGVRSMFLFGVSYAVASLSCTLPVFLSVVVGSLATTTLAGGLAVLVVYGAAMSLSLLGVTVAVALARHGAIGRLRRLSRHVSRVAGIMLVVSGVYIIAYWGLVLVAGSGATAGTGGFVEALSQRAVSFIDGNWPVVGVVLSVVVVGALLRLGLHRAGDPATDDADARSTGRPR